MSHKADLGALFGAQKADTFLGLQKCDDLASASASSAFIGAPAATPYGSVGAYAKNGPASLRAAMAALTANRDRYNFDIDGPVFPVGCLPAVDCGDLPYSETDFASNRAAIAAATATLAGRGITPIVIGGDDSVPIPMIEAMGSTGRRFTILQIDAHIDWRDMHMGERLGLSSTMRRASEMGHIDNIIQVGARGIGSAHQDDYRDALAWGAQFFTAKQIHVEGVAAVFSAIPKDTELVICFDIDALDPSVAPNTIGRAPGGLSYAQLLALLEGAAKQAPIAAMDVVEILPEADIDGLGGLAVSRLVVAAMGLIARQKAGML